MKIRKLCEFSPNLGNVPAKNPITFEKMSNAELSDAAELCDICSKGDQTDHSVPDQGLSCMRCGIAMCDECYNLSVRLYGFVGDKNMILGKPSEVSTTFNDWPFDEYFPEDFGGYKLSRGCISCMTSETRPKRDKFGHFMRGDDYPAGESLLTREIAEKKHTWIPNKKSK